MLFLDAVNNKPDSHRPAVAGSAMGGRRHRRRSVAQRDPRWPVRVDDAGARIGSDGEACTSATGFYRYCQGEHTAQTPCQDDRPNRRCRSTLPPRRDTDEVTCQSRGVSPPEPFHTRATNSPATYLGNRRASHRSAKVAEVGEDGERSQHPSGNTRLELAFTSFIAACSCSPHAALWCQSLRSLPPSAAPTRRFGYVRFAHCRTGVRS